MTFSFFNLVLASFLANVATLILTALAVVGVVYIDQRHKEKQLNELLERSTPTND